MRANYSNKMMAVKRCAEITLDAAYRRREVLMGPGEWVTLFKAVTPGLVDWLAVKVPLAAAARRMLLGKIEAQP